MENYPEDVLVKEAVKLFFERFRIPENAYSAKSFSIPVGKLRIHIPNIPARVKVAKLHDIHHVLTGYPANWRGEAEIGAWELATGCQDYFVAWFLNAGAVAVGLLMYPLPVIRAFRRGLHSKHNLYQGFQYEDVLGYRVKDLREKIGLAEA